MPGRPVALGTKFKIKLKKKIWCVNGFECRETKKKTTEKSGVHSILFAAAFDRSCVISGDGEFAA